MNAISKPLVRQVDVPLKQIKQISKQAINQLIK